MIDARIISTISLLKGAGNFMFVIVISSFDFI